MRKTALITGAGSGIGKALAIHFARKGYDLGIMGRSVTPLQEVAAEAELLGAKVMIHSGDVASEADCKAFIDACMTGLGRIDVLICNAGISMRAVFADTDLSVLHKLMDTNFWGTVNCVKHALPHILSSNGSIVGISSIAGFKGLPGRTGYSASKFAMHGFLESLRTENLPQKLHVLIACPGYTASNIRNTALNSNGNAQGETPLDESKLVPPDRVAAAIFEAVRRRKLYLVMTAKGKFVVWLSKFFPALVDRLTYNHISKEADSPFT